MKIVKFTKHAIERLRQRFPGAAAQLATLVERGILNQTAKPAQKGRWMIRGTIEGRSTKVVLVEFPRGMYTVITFI